MGRTRGLNPGPIVPSADVLYPVIIFGLRFAFFTHISGKKRTDSKYVRLKNAMIFDK